MIGWESLKNRLEAIITKAEKAFIRKSWGKNIAKIAAAVIIAVTLLASNPTVATAMKKICSQTVIQWFDKYISVETKADNYPIAIKDVEVGYITDGFVFEEKYILYPESFTFSYKGAYGYIIIHVRLDNGNTTTFIDNENTTFADIEINGNKGLALYRNDGGHGIIVSDDGIVYDILGYVEMKEILKIYKNIKIIL